MSGVPAKPGPNSRALTEREKTLVETTARHLVRVLRRRVDDPKRGLDQKSAAAVAWMQVCRKERPGGTLGVDARELLRVEIELLAERLDPSRQQSLVGFARAVATNAVRRIPPRQSVNARAATSSHSALARAAVRAEMLGASDDADIVRRATLRMLREKRRGRVGHRTLFLDDTDPLRDLLDLPAARSSLLRQDIRHSLVRGKMGNLLREASRFSDVTLRDVLGEELWALGRPVGFADGRCRSVLIEVDSDALAHELSLRKPELLSRLQAAPGLDKVKDVRFAVKDRQVLPVVGERTRPPTLDDVVGRMRERANRKKRGD